MTAPAGQADWRTQGTGTNDYIVPFELAHEIYNEKRFRSVIGRLSKSVNTVKEREGTEVDVGSSALVWSKTVKNTDQVRFTLRQNMMGTTTYGDAPLSRGDYLAYMHAVVYLNSSHSPVVPIPGEMSLLRVNEVLGDESSAVRDQLSMYMAEEQVLEFYDGFHRGASRNLLSPTSQGALALNLGNGAGVQVSPENILIPGNGFVSGTTGTSGYETNLCTALGTLTNTTSDMFSREFIHELRAAITDKKIEPAQIDGMDGEKWIALVDPRLMTRITRPGDTLATLWLYGMERSKKNPVFGHGAIEIDDIIFMPDKWLSKFRPNEAQAAAGVVQWGNGAADKRDYDTDSHYAELIIGGKGMMLEANNGSLEITVEKEPHRPKHLTFHASIKESYMRTRYVPKDGRTGQVINRSSMSCFFYEPGLSWES